MSGGDKGMRREAQERVDDMAAEPGVPQEVAMNLATLWVAAGSLIAAGGGAFAALSGLALGESVAIVALVAFFALAAPPMMMGAALYFAALQQRGRAQRVHV